MKKLVIFATIEVQPGTRDAAMKLPLAHRARCLRDRRTALSSSDAFAETRKIMGDPRERAIA